MGHFLLTIRCFDFPVDRLDWISLDAEDWTIRPYLDSIIATDYKLIYTSYDILLLLIMLLNKCMGDGAAQTA